MDDLPVNVGPITVAETKAIIQSMKVGRDFGQDVEK